MSMKAYRSVVTPKIDYERCQACRTCAPARACRFKAVVRIEREEAPYIAIERCNGCGDCAPLCPHHAIVAP